MKIAVRVDAFGEMGSGHFMRCLALALSLKSKGVEVFFISRDLPCHMVDMLSSANIFYFALKGGGGPSSGDLKHSRWLQTSQSSDAIETLNVLADSHWDWIIVDHYALDCRWEALVRPVVNKIMVIDDLADRIHDCDILLDQNLYPDVELRYRDKIPQNCIALLGPKYALLRDEFLIWRRVTLPRSGKVHRVLIFLGGFDYENYTTLVVRALSSIKLQGIKVDVIIGGGHPFRDDLEKLCVELGYCCHIQTTRVAELMSRADFSIGAGGSATWERCSLGLPSCILALADNQIDIAREVAGRGGCVYLGLASEIDFLKLQEYLAHYIEAPNQLALISEKAYELVDGLGIRRVCDVLGLGGLA